MLPINVESILCLLHVLRCVFHRWMLSRITRIEMLSKSARIVLSLRFLSICLYIFVHENRNFKDRQKSNKPHIFQIGVLPRISTINFCGFNVDFDIIWICLYPLLAVGPLERNPLEPEIYSAWILVSRHHCLWNISHLQIVYIWKSENYSFRPRGLLQYTAGRSADFHVISSCAFLCDFNGR